MKESLILPDKVLCFEPEAIDELKNGIIRPGQVLRTPVKRGIITMVGSECSTAKVGMAALYIPLSATRFIADDDKEYALLPETSILFLYRE